MTATRQFRSGSGLMMVRIAVQASSVFFITAALLRQGALATTIGRRLIAAQPEVALMGLTLSVVALWIALTLCLGRIYCSTLCPLGALMDLVGRARPNTRVFRYKKPLDRLRIGFFILFLLLSVATTIDFGPYNLYFNIVRTYITPTTILSTILATAVVILIVAVAYRRGRLLCNTLCPVGAALGYMARRAALHFDIDTDRCTQCRRCADVCKAECINLDDHVVDMTRCVVCFNCLPECPDEAISYTVSRHRLSTPLMQPTACVKTDETVS